MLSPELLQILACPRCKGQLRLDLVAGFLECEKDRLRYRIEEGIPVMLEEEAETY